MLKAVMLNSKKPISYDDLVVQARTQNQALGELYDRFHDQIYRFCRYRLYTTEAAEDVTSEIFLNVARKIPTFRGETEQEFRRWLYAVAANQANAYIRKTKRRHELFTAAVRAVESPPNINLHNQPAVDWDTLHQALKQLKPRHQNIIILRFVEDFSHEQIAAILSLKPVTVRVGLNRALKKLRKILQTSFDGDR